MGQLAQRSYPQPNRRRNEKDFELTLTDKKVQELKKLLDFFEVKARAISNNKKLPSAAHCLTIYLSTIFNTLHRKPALQTRIISKSLNCRCLRFFRVSNDSSALRLTDSLISSDGNKRSFNELKFLLTKTFTKVFTKPKTFINQGSSSYSLR